jgi:hypothetical protein
MPAQRAQRSCRVTIVFEPPLRTFAAPIATFAVKFSRICLGWFFTTKGTMPAQRAQKSCRVAIVFEPSLRTFAAPIATFAVKFSRYALVGFLPQRALCRRKGHRGHVVQQSCSSLLCEPLRRPWRPLW